MHEWPGRCRRDAAFDGVASRVVVLGDHQHERAHHIHVVLAGIGFMRHATVANVVMMGLGIWLTGYQVAGYIAST